MSTIPADARLRLCVLREEPLDPREYLEAIADPSAGGHHLFIGTVRNHADGRSVERLEYSAHPTALEQMRVVGTEVLARHQVVAIALGHRIGALEVGDAAVICAVSAAHRDQAFAAGRDLIDLLKQRVPIWKHEHFSDGASVWVGTTDQNT